jgi:single-strand DNA-binding protein
MSDFNKTILSGRITRDAELKNLPSGITVCDFGFASNRKYGDKEETTFVDCSIFGKKAEALHQYLVKGKGLIVEGRLRLETWGKDDQKRSKLSIVVEDVTFLSSGEKQTQKVESEERSIPDMSYVDLTENVPF